MSGQRLTLIGLENGAKRTLSWTREGGPTGDPEWQLRFRQRWDAADPEAFRLGLAPQDREHYETYLAEHILKKLCPETLDFFKADVYSTEQIQRITDSWNAAPGGHRYTVDVVRERLERRWREDHRGPPHWRLVKDSDQKLARQMLGGILGFC